MLRNVIAIAVLLGASACTRAPTPPASPPPPPERAAPKLVTFTATAYSIEGRTASGIRSREGIVAADPAVLPLGSRIRVHDAGQYSGEYAVHDTGKAINGHEIDIYLADDTEAKRFGRRRVKVEVLRYGDGKR